VIHDFDAFKGAAEMPYNPKDYGLPIWRDEDHQPPETVEQEPQTAEIMSAEEAKCKLCSWAMSQIGYHEDANNWQKYAENEDLQRMYGWKPQNQPWCDVFVDSGFIICFGLAAACAMTYQRMGEGSALCRQSAQYYMDNGAFVQTPEIGDQVFFNVNGAINHTGIVVRVDGGSVHTVEGNSSDMVAERVYSVNDSNRIAGYGRPNWAIVSGESIDPRPADHIADDGKKADEQRTYTLTMPYLQCGSYGEAVWVVQTLLQVHNISCGSYGADKDFGADTEKAVREYQRKHGLRADGVVGPETGAALFGGEVYTPEEIKSAPEASSFWNNLIGKIRK